MNLFATLVLVGSFPARQGADSVKIEVAEAVPLTRR